MYPILIKPIRRSLAFVIIFATCSSFGLIIFKTSISLAQELEETRELQERSRLIRHPQPRTPATPLTSPANKLIRPTDQI